MLLNEAIAIPTEIQQGDLVFRLADAEDDPKATLDTYVVTDQLLESFVAAVGLVRSAVDDGVSKASYLSGSFGAGKSNFMGVLQLLLDGHPGALAKAELAPVVKELRDWQGERTFLAVPFHLIGARNLESAILGGYVEYVQAHHPGVPLPDVFADEALLTNADQLRQAMGDALFFTNLGGSGSNDDGWGDLGGWNSERYQAARSASVGDSERTLLVQALLDSLLSGYAEGARANSGGYRDLDGGLAAISRHAELLGFAGIILFLDELILWLLSRMADVAFATAEASKISQLVEGATSDRPVPIISIIARQRDLRELVGHEVPGLEKMAFVDQLDFQQGRFSNITLDDSNLPVVAHHRLLQPSSPEGAAALASAFASLDLSPGVRDALSGESGGTEAFALTYPFSPAFLTIVVDVAGALQRTRTGLRVLLQLLVDRREELTVGDLVPVGDLYDVLANSEDPLSEEMKSAFAQAKRIYAERLRPLLVASHGLTEGSAANEGFHTDDRLIKTLLLAALVPQSEPFRNLTVSRLVALNHGLISSPVPGQETSIVVNKLRSWSVQVGELQLGSDAHDPTVGIVLSDVDTRSILASVQAYDNVGSRRQLIRDLIVADLGLTPDVLAHTYRIAWKGVQREVDLRFANVRDPEDIGDSGFANDGDRWKIIIDFPFDADGYSPLDDLSRIEGFRDQGKSWRTAIWLPSFFTPATREVLGTLVRLNQLLANNDRFAEGTKNLSSAARASVRPQLETQQRAARQNLDGALLMAYGAIGADAAVVDSTHGLADHFPSLQAGFTVVPPVPTESKLRAVLDGVIEQALVFSYPAAPAITRDARVGELRKVLDICQQALDLPDGRLPLVPAAERSIMTAIANPLRLGTQSEQAFVVDALGGHWDNHFTRWLARRDQAGESGPATVADLRHWIDEPDPMGLTRELQNLVLVVWASATNRAFTDHGGPAGVAVDQLADHLEVVAQALPAPLVWDVARDRAERIFGVAQLPDAASANGLAKLSAALGDAAARYGHDAQVLVAELQRLIALAEPTSIAGGKTDVPARLRSAQSALTLMASLGSVNDNVGRAEALAGASIMPSPEAVGRSLSSTHEVLAAIRDIDHDIFANALDRPAGLELRTQLAQVLAVDELAQPLVDPLKDIYEKARAIVLAVSTPDPSAGPGPAVPAAEQPAIVSQLKPVRGRRLVHLSTKTIGDALTRLEALRERLVGEDVADLQVEITYTEPDDSNPGSPS
jgi:hypothetical protein